MDSKNIIKALQVESELQNFYKDLLIQCKQELSEAKTKEEICFLRYYFKKKAKEKLDKSFEKISKILKENH